MLSDLSCMRVNVFCVRFLLLLVRNSSAPKDDRWALSNHRSMHIHSRTSLSTMHDADYNIYTSCPQKLCISNSSSLLHHHPRPLLQAKKSSSHKNPWRNSLNIIHPHPLLRSRSSQSMPLRLHARRGFWRPNWFLFTNPVHTDNTSPPKLAILRHPPCPRLVIIHRQYFRQLAPLPV